MDKSMLISILADYNYMKVRILEIPDEIQTSPAGDINSWIKSKNNTSKVVENQAIRLANNKEYNNYKKYIEAIDELANRYENRTEEKDILKTHILNKYTKKSIGVNELIRQLQVAGYDIDRVKFYRIRDSICDDLKKLIK